LRSFPSRQQGDFFDALARLRPPLILTILLLLVGTLGYMAIEGFPFVDAMYMTVISVATVGFGEVHPLSTGGRLFTMGLIMGGFAVFSYSVGVFVEVITRRDIFGLFRIQTMESRIKSLADHYIIVGYTTIAQELARIFRRRGMLFVVVEPDAERVEMLKHDQVEFFIQDDYFRHETYRKAAVGTARGIITSFENDSDNITVVVTGRIVEEATGRDLFIVSTCSNEESKVRLERVGADYVISPDTLIGNRIGALALRPPTLGSRSVLEQVAFGETTDLDIREMLLPEGVPMVGKSVRDSDLRRLTGAYIVAITHEGRRPHINPSPDEILRAGDTLMVIGTPRQLDTLEHLLRPTAAAGVNGTT